MCWAGSEISTMKNPLDLWIRSFPNDLFEQKKRAAWAVIGGNHGNGHALGSRDFESFLEIKGDDIFWIDSKLLLYQIPGNFTAVDRTMTPSRRKSNIVIAVEMAEEVSIAALNCAISKCIDTDEETWHDLVERTGPLICWLSSGFLLRGGGVRPCSIFGVP